MSDPNRGPYASERPLAFDRPTEPRGGGGGPAPVTLILSILVLLAVVGGVFYLYRGGLRAPDGPPQPVGAPVGDVRVAAPPQATPPDPAAGLSIYKDNPGASSGAPAFVPPPEQPTPRPAGPASAAQAPEASPAAVASVAPSTPAADAAPPPAKHGKPTSIDALLADAGPPPAATPRKTAVAAPPAGGFSVQIGAFSSEALADKGWNAAASVAPGAMAGKGKRVTPLAKADGTTLYRTAITGFESRDQAEALCARLTAAGKSCFVR